MRALLLTTFALLTCITYAQQEPTLFHRATIYYDTPADLTELIAHGVTVDHGTRKAGVQITSDFSAQELQIANSLGFQTQIEIHDVKAYYKDQARNPHKYPSLYEQQKNASCTGSEAEPFYSTPAGYYTKPGTQFGGYYTYAEILTHLNDMRTQFPNLVTAPADIHTFNTEEGRGIKHLVLSNQSSTNTSKPKVLYTAIHHAREVGSVQQLIFYMWYLLENYGTDPTVTTILDNTELYFVPVINPDGYVYNETIDPDGGGLWRKNRSMNSNGTRGVDLNRNYPYTDQNGVQQWSGTNASSNPGSDTYQSQKPKPWRGW